MRQLSTLDAQFLGVESARTFPHFSVLGTYDPSPAPGGTVTLSDLRGRVEERLHLLPPFRWRLVEVPLCLDLPYWAEDPDFDLGFHIREAAVPPPGDDRQVAETVARIVARPLDRSRSRPRRPTRWWRCGVRTSRCAARRSATGRCRPST